MNDLENKLEKIRADFPILHTKVRGKNLVYLDNAATTHKPLSVIKSLETYYEQTNANVHRGVHYLSEKATKEYEASRDIIQKFVGAKSRKEIIFTRGTTDAINLVAQAYGRNQLKPGDEVLITEMEHHSNIVPWQMVCEQTGAKLQVTNVLENGDLDMESFEKLLNDKTKVVSVVHISNTLGSINPIKEIIKKAHAVGAIAVIDGAQSIQHLPVNVADLDCDFYAFSGHKLYGPTGIGVLYGKEKLLEVMPPYQGGGDMIRTVSFEKTTYNDLPYKFEAGTPHIAGAIGLGVAANYITTLGFNFIQEQETFLLKIATAKLNEMPEVRIIGTTENKSSVISFLLKDIHAHDVGTILDQEGVAVRAGHHCTQPLMDKFKVPATARASFSFYNKESEIDELIKAIKKTLEIFK